MNKIYIIDAINFLFRSYYGIGPMTNDSGGSTSALFGFIRSVQKIFKDFSPEHVVCVFDGFDNKKSRREVYADYKAHRKGAPEDLFPQFELALEYCRLAGISTLQLEGVEADDTMATVAVWAAKQGATAYLCTSDKDMMQLVGSNIFMLHAHKDNFLVDEKRVEEIFGVPPSQMLDLLAIMGDASDNIPGLEGFGAKTAATLLKEFGSLDALLAHPELVKGAKKQEILRTQKEIALMSRQLATLDLNLQVPREAEFYRLDAPQREALISFFQSMKFSSLIRDLGEDPLTIATAEQKLVETNYILVDTEVALEQLLSALSKHSQVCIDTETDSLEPLEAKLVGIGFSVEPGNGWYVPFKNQKQLIDFLNKTECAFYGHNVKYDWHVLKNIDIELKHICFDTLLASYILQPQNRRHNLDELALEKFQKIKIPIEELLGKGKSARTMFEVPVEQVSAYCCEDVDYTCRLKELFEAELKEKKLKDLFYTVELPLLTILAHMERTGIYVDVAEMNALGQLLNFDLHDLKMKVFSAVGEEFNLNSPKQLSHILYETLAIPSKTTSTAADVLEELAPDYPIVQTILEYRGLEKLRSTYAESLPQMVNSTTGRIHCTFNQSVAATGRLSCQDPNLQNIPVRSKQGLAIRACFKPQKPNWSFVGADYSQIELRLLAHFSEDPELMKAFNQNEDIHAYTASLVFGVPLAAVEPEMRAQAKTVNFGILYGQGPFGLSKQLGISMRDASSFIKTYFERYPKVSAYLETSREQARKTGMSVTLTGRQRPIPDLQNKNAMIRSAAERLAVNTPLQGTAADLIKMAMIEIDKEIKVRALKGHMILQIHDELIFEVPDDEVDLFKLLAKEKMEGVFQLKVPLVVDIAVGKNWAEC
jgi:DNA polymerase-1